MDLCLIALAWTDPYLWLAVLKVAVGLGFVIFVHELGHFAVAKACGVKCEKFYLGFDIAGWKFCKFTYGETEYGIGILPLGGYVKMLGQEDNPARLREEIERAKQADDEAAGDGDKPTDAKQAGDPKGESIDVVAAEAALYDPRSYLAQNVPKRMAIISAGVIMNLIFAWVMAAVAFSPGMGVTRNKCVVGHLLPGQAAWQKDIRVGDALRLVGDRKMRKFRDMQEAIMLGDKLEDGVPIVLDRPGVEEPLTLIVEPDSSGMLPMIGITSPATMTLHAKYTTLPGSPAHNASPGFEPGDTIEKIGVVVDGKTAETFEIENIVRLHEVLAAHADKALSITVRRNVGDADKKAKGDGDKAQDGVSTQVVSIDVGRSPMRRLGLVMKMGRISAVQEKSAAAKKGIRPGDRIVDIHATSGDSLELGDPLTLGDRLRNRAGEEVVVTIERKKKTKKVTLTLDRTDSFEIPSRLAADSPITVPALGVAYYVLNEIKSLVTDGAVRQAKAKNKELSIPGPDDVLKSATLIPPKGQTPEQDKWERAKWTVEFDKEDRNWPIMIYGLQEELQGTQVELTWKRDGKEHTETFTPMPANDWFDPERGFNFATMTFMEKGSSIGEAIRMGGEETIHSTLMVYRFLQKLGARQVSPKALGGPVSIFVVAKHYAERGTSDLLIFLTLLSANLAVINFLPIPLLDGGHMVLLAWEGIRGKPASERIQIALTYLGLAFILSLMIWVIGLDIWRLMSG